MAIMVSLVLMLSIWISLGLCVYIIWWLLFRAPY